MKSHLKPPEEWTIPSSGACYCPFLSQANWLHRRRTWEVGKDPDALMAVTSAKPPAEPRCPISGSFPPVWCLRSPRPLPPGTSFSRVPSGLPFPRSEERCAAHLLVRDKRGRWPFGDAVLFLAMETLFFLPLLLTSLLGKQTQNLGLVGSIF